MRYVTNSEMLVLESEFGGPLGNMNETLFYYVARMDGVQPVEAIRILKDFNCECNRRAKEKGYIYMGQPGMPVTPLLLEEFRFFAKEQEKKDG